MEKIKKWISSYLSACSLCVPLKFVNVTNCERSVLVVITIFANQNQKLWKQLRFKSIKPMNELPFSSIFTRLLQ